MKEEQMSHLSNLIALAHADGRLDVKEKNLIISIGTKMGLGKNEIEKLIDNRASVEFIFPEKETERYHQLYELITLIMIDGHIHENEVKLLKKYAKKLNFQTEIINPLIEKIKDFLVSGYDQNRIQLDLNNLINKI